MRMRKATHRTSAATANNRYLQVSAPREREHPKFTDTCTVPRIICHGQEEEPLRG